MFVPLLLLVGSAAAAPVTAPPGGTVDAWVAARAREVAAAPGDIVPRRLFRSRPRGAALPGFSPPRSLAPLIQSVSAGVVGIRTVNAASAGDETPVDTPASSGSGFILSVDGYVVTNHHVVEDAQEIRVIMVDDREFHAAVVGTDALADVALLKLEDPVPPGLPGVYLGDSDVLEVGDWVLAMGNPLGFDHTVTHGIVSAVGRELPSRPGLTHFIQTDAPTNVGNSGGPLFDMRGEVVGVMTARGSGEGIGFAVPINLVKDLLPNLLENGRLERGWLGVSVQAVARAVVVRRVTPGSPAARGGLKVGDRINGLNGRQVESYRELVRRLSVFGPGTVLRFNIQRAGGPQEIKVTLAERPDGSEER